MAKKLTADDLIAGIADLEATIRAQVVADIISGLKDATQLDGDGDTWEDGLRSAIETIESNY